MKDVREEKLEEIRKQIKVLISERKHLIKEEREIVTGTEEKGEESRNRRGDRISNKPSVDVIMMCFMVKVFVQKILDEHSFIFL